MNALQNQKCTLAKNLRGAKTKLGLLLFSLALASFQTQAAPVLYGSAYQGPNSPASLYNIDPATGAATLIGAIGFNQVSGLDFNTNGTLYGVGYNGAGTQELLTINPATGAGTAVGPTGIPANTQDTAFTTINNVLYAYSGGRIYTINTGTGAGTFLGNSGDGFASGAGLAYYESSGILYKADANNLWTVNPVTGAETAVVAMNYPLFNERVNGMDFDQTTGTLWASLNAGNGGNGPNYLGTVNITTGQVTDIGQTVNGLNALAVLIVPGSVPEPATMSLIGLGLAGLLGLRRVKRNS